MGGNCPFLLGRKKSQHSSVGFFYQFVGIFNIPNESVVLLLSSNFISVKRNVSRFCPCFTVCLVNIVYLCLLVGLFSSCEPTRTTASIVNHYHMGLGL